MFSCKQEANVAESKNTESTEAEPKSDASNTTESNSNVSGVKKITTAKLKQLMKEKENLILLDVRTDEEIAAGMIPNARHLNYYDDGFNDALAKFDKSAPIVLYCRSGGRAGKGAEILSELGYNEVYNYGGYDRWVAESE